MTPQLTAKQWVLSHLIAAGMLGLAVFQVFSVTGRATAVTFLDVGQGDAILIQTPEHKNVLIDAGPDAMVVDRLSAHMGFFDKTIDLFILTHPHRDHFVGVMDILQKYQIRQVMLTGVVLDDPLYTDLIQKLKSRGIPFVFPNGGQDWQIGRHEALDVLFPFEGQSLLGRTFDNANNSSIVARLTDTATGRTVMLTGDAEKELEREILLSGADVKSDALKLGHHGSRTATSDIFLQAVRPQTAVISAGKDNTFGHPHAETLEKLKDISVRQTIVEGDIGLW